MKKFAVLLILTAIFAFAGCQGDSSENETEQTAETPKVPEIVYHTVSFESNSETTIEPQTVESGKTATEPSKPTKTGYTFSAWYEGENAFDFSTPITKDTTLTAKWTANTYTIRFDANGGVGAMDPMACTYNVSTNLPTCAFTRDGYVLVYQCFSQNVQCMLRKRS